LQQKLLVTGTHVNSVPSHYSHTVFWNPVFAFADLVMKLPLNVQDYR